jgi:hypothetical protein
VGMAFKYFSNERLNGGLGKNSSWVKKKIALYLQGNQSPVLEFLVFLIINFDEKKNHIGQM